jgi:hypothetical protein
MPTQTAFVIHVMSSVWHVLALDQRIAALVALCSMKELVLMHVHQIHSRMPVASAFRAMLSVQTDVKDPQPLTVTTVVILL